MNDPKMAAGGYRPRLSPFKTGLAGRCPSCGRGRLFSGFLTVTPRCDGCGLDLAGVDSGDGPAVFIVFILGALVVPMALLTESWFHPPFWLQMVIWCPVILLGAILLLRPFKGVMIALQYRHRATSRDRLG